jgi:hypothetical protein
MEDLESRSLRYIGEVKAVLTAMERDSPPPEDAGDCRRADQG